MDILNILHSLLDGIIIVLKLLSFVTIALISAFILSIPIQIIRYYFICREMFNESEYSTKNTECANNTRGILYYIKGGIKDYYYVVRHCEWVQEIFMGIKKCQTVSNKTPHDSIPNIIPENLNIECSKPIHRSNSSTAKESLSTRRKENRASLRKV